MLHPRHKLAYFKNLKWTNNWIKIARGIVEEEYKKNYKGKFDKGQGKNAGAASEADGDPDVEEAGEGENEDVVDNNNNISMQDPPSTHGDTDNEDEERDPVVSDPEDEVHTHPSLLAQRLQVRTRETRACHAQRTCET